MIKTQSIDYLQFISTVIEVDILKYLLCALHVKLVLRSSLVKFKFSSLITTFPSITVKYVSSIILFSFNQYNDAWGSPVNH